MFSTYYEANTFSTRLCERYIFEEQIREKHVFFLCIDRWKSVP